MKEFMLLIRNSGEQKDNMPEEEHKKFLDGCRNYIDDLKKNGKLIAAQPLVREGKIISGTPGKWKEEDFNSSEEVQVGYYHILANDLEEAISIAKRNPEFVFSSTAKIEVRPVKMKEQTT